MTSRTVLIAWELGGGLGHILPHLSLALALRDNGYRVVFALRDLTHAHAILGAHGFEYAQAPFRYTRPRHVASPVCHYAHILKNIGYVETDSLHGRVEAWQALFRWIKPDVMLCNHSPTALLAARGHAFKRIAIGTGFTIPPDCSPLPVFRKQHSLAPEQLLADEHEVLHSINALLTAKSLPPLSRVSQIFDTDATILNTFAELDHYPSRSGATYWAPWPTGGGIDVEWPQVTGKKIFAYLKPSPSLTAILTTLKNSAQPTLVFGDGIDASIENHFSGRTLRFSHQPLDIAQISEACDLAITNATHTTTCQLLLRGKPTLLAPLTPEQEITGERVTQLGAGLLLSAERCAVQLHAMLYSNKYRDAAQKFAARYAHIDPQKQATDMLTLVRELSG